MPLFLFFKIRYAQGTLTWNLNPENWDNPPKNHVLFEQGILFQAVGTIAPFIYKIHEL